MQHLQKKIGTLEDTLEDMRATNEREDAAVRERIKRYKEREEAIRKELAEGRQETERVRKAEEKARLRVEELEEALRENTVTLENARAEIETLRNEIAVSLCYIVFRHGCGAVEHVSRGCARGRILRVSRQLPLTTLPTNSASLRLVLMLTALNSKRRSRTSSSSLHRPRQSHLVTAACGSSRTKYTSSRRIEKQ